MKENTIILESVVGSVLHGTSVQDGLEDQDFMGVCIEDFEDFAGFGTSDCWVERTKPTGARSEAGDVDRTIYGLKKYLNLALKGNPSVLLLLFAPIDAIKTLDARGCGLRELKKDIISKQVAAPFKGYIRQQHERLLGLRGQRNVTRPELVDKYGYDTKYAVAGHIVRLGFQGEELLLAGNLTLPMPEEQRRMVVDVRSGKYSLAEISGMLLEAEKKVDEALEVSTLPQKPATAKVEAWMLDTYLETWKARQPKLVISCI
jgi:predicted nucleotidyltransferase